MTVSAVVPKIEHKIGEMEIDRLGRTRLIQQYIESLPNEQKYILVYGFKTEEARQNGDLTQAILFAPVTKCRSLRRQMHLDRHDTGYVWTDYYDGHTKQSVGDYDDAFEFLGGTVFDVHYYDEEGKEL